MSKDDQRCARCWFGIGEMCHNPHSKRFATRVYDGFTGVQGCDRFYDREQANNRSCWKDVHREAT